MIQLCKIKKIHFLIILGLVSFASCSKHKDSRNTSWTMDPGVIEPGTVAVSPNILAVAARDAEGFYQANLAQINPEVGKEISGLMTLKVQGDYLKIIVKVTGVEEYSVHAQYIQTAAKCPTIDNDMNNDGLIDFKEAERVSGKILIPVDGDLSAQLLDYNVFPAANGSGKYHYSNSASFSLMLSDLLTEDTDPDDSYTKLIPGERLNIEGRVFVVYGAPSSLLLPPTVSRFNSLSRNASLPIACGLIGRVTEESESY